MVAVGVTRQSQVPASPILGVVMPVISMRSEGVTHRAVEAGVTAVLLVCCCHLQCLLQYLFPLQQIPMVHTVSVGHQPPRQPVIPLLRGLMVAVGVTRQSRVPASPILGVVMAVIGMRSGGVIHRAVEAGVTAVPLVFCCHLQCLVTLACRPRRSLMAVLVSVGPPQALRQVIPCRRA